MFGGIDLARAIAAASAFATSWFAVVLASAALIAGWTAVALDTPPAPVARAGPGSRPPRDGPIRAEIRGDWPRPTMEPWSGRSRPRSAEPWMPGCTGCRAGNPRPTADGCRRAYRCIGSLGALCRGPLAPTCRTVYNLGYIDQVKAIISHCRRIHVAEPCPCCRPSSTSRRRATARAVTVRAARPRVRGSAARPRPGARCALPLHDRRSGRRGRRRRRPAAAHHHRRGEGGPPPEVGLADDYANMMGAKCTQYCCITGCASGIRHAQYVEPQIAAMLEELTRSLDAPFDPNGDTRPRRAVDSADGGARAPSC